MVEVSDTTLEPIGAVQRTRVGREATEPMRADIRLLGTILGDTVREQSGEEVFDLVERARVESFRVRRSEIDRAEMARMFDGIDIRLAIPVIRAFSHFSLLANAAEDIHRERRRAFHVDAGEPPQDSSLAATYAKLDLAALDSATVTDALHGALVSPVITAHPTETRRRTVFVTQHRITQLMGLRAAGHTETDDGRSIDLESRRQVLTLWQTALIRLSRLQITDEIDVGLRYYPAALFKVIYGWGLRRQEAAMLDVADFAVNPAAPELGGLGVCHVRYGKAMRGSPPRRRAVATVMPWAAEALAQYLQDVRPRCGTPSHPALC